MNAQYRLVFSLVIDITGVINDIHHVDYMFGVDYNEYFGGRPSG